MKRYFIIIVITTFVIGLTASCENGKEKERDISIKQPQVETVALKRTRLATELRLPAELSGFRQVDIYAKVNSYVKTLLVDIGTEVQKGQLLMELEAPEISSQVAAAQSRLSSQEALYMATKATYERVLETSKVEGTISKNDLDQALARMTSDRAQLEAARASFKEVRSMQDYLIIRAPFDGLVTARNINVGTYVGPAGKGSEFPLLILQDHKKLRLVASVPEMYTGYLHIGSDIGFNVRSLPNENFSAKIARMSGALDSRLRSERVEMDITDTGRLLPGMVAEVILPLTARDSTFVVPVSAVMTYSEGTFVIRDHNAKAQRIAIKKGREANGEMEIFSDELRPNDRLVKFANEEIREGTTLK
ncbi:MAG: efflux RND transporter periplasmic adaptor subunit [Sediminicola sp.]